MALLLNLGIIVLTSIVIMYACDSFELASRKLGEKFPPGVRGATINAIASSLPELFTSFFLLFLFQDKDGFSGSIATCAGSAIFNAVIIPALCVMAVLFWGIKVNGKKQSVETIKLQRGGLVRDGVFFLLSSLFLIFLLSGRVLHWWMGAALVGLYGFYILYIYFEYKRGKIEVDEEDDDDEEEEDPPSTIKAILTLDFHWLLFKRKTLTTGRAWVLLILGTIFIAIPCHFLANACVNVADLANVPLFFTAVILAAAATSVPDTIISIRDARKGDYDDAISNAFGSNIFDIGIGLGLPLLLYGIVYGKDVTFKTIESVMAVQELQIILVFITIIVMAIFLIGRTLGKLKALMLFSLYGLFLVYVVGRIYEWPWLVNFMKSLHITFT